MDAGPSPLAKKLKLKPGARAAVVGAPDGYLERLGLPAGSAAGTTLEGPLDWIQVFVADSAELAAVVPGITKAVAPDASCAQRTHARPSPTALGYEPMLSAFQ